MTHWFPYNHLNHLSLWSSPKIPESNIISLLEYVIVNFFSSGNIYFSLVSTSLAYITIPQNKRKTKLPGIKK